MHRGDWAYVHNVHTGEPLVCAYNIYAYTRSDSNMCHGEQLKPPNTTAKRHCSNQDSDPRPHKHPQWVTRSRIPTQPLPNPAECPCTIASNWLPYMAVCMRRSRAVMRARYACLRGALDMDTAAVSLDAGVPMNCSNLAWSTSAVSK